MNANAIVNQLKNIKGQNVKACWARPIATPKDCSLTIIKTTCAYVRAGIDYANLASVKDGIESGERDEVGKLPWGEWTEFPFVITHKGQDYVRLYPASFDNLPMNVSYTIDGKPVTSEQVYLVAKKGEVKVHQISLETFASRVSPAMQAKANTLVQLANDARYTFSDAIAAMYLEICNEEKLDKETIFTLKAESLLSIG